MAILTLMSFIFIGILYAAWKRYIRSGPIYETNVSLKGKTVLITGGSSGIGKATAIGLAKHDARVIIASRDVDKALRAVAEIKSESSNENVLFMRLDLSDLGNVREFADEFVTKEARLDVLVNNAGVISAEQTQDGGSIMLTTNILGPFLLTNLLLPLLEETGSSRIVTTTSDVYLLTEIDPENLFPVSENNSSLTNVISLYAMTKLMSIYFSTELNKILRVKNPESFDVSAFILHPGTAFSDLGLRFASRSLFWSLLRRITLALTARSAFYCSQTVLYCCMESGLEEKSGEYFADLKPAELWPHAKDPMIGRKLWIGLQRLTGLRE